MEEWKEYRLGDFMEFNPTVRLSKNTVARKVTMDQLVPHCRDIYNWTYEPYSGGAKFQNGDTIMARITPCLENGKHAFISFLDDDEIAYGSTEYIVIRGRKEISDNLFVYYLSHYPEFKDTAVKSMVGSSGRQRAQVDMLENIMMFLPSIPEQHRIANFLSSLDDKIEVNRRINDNLEQQAQALFKSWFIDFEPFKDGEFVESEMGMIPKGWRVETIDSLVEISKKSVNPHKYQEVQFVHYSIPSYDNGKQPEKQFGREVLSNKFVVKDKMTLFSKLNPRIKRVWFVNDAVDNSICSTEFVPYMAQDIVLSAFVYCLISSQGFYDFVMSLVNGATGSHQRFHPEETLSYRQAFNSEVALRFSGLVEPMITQTLKNQQESRRLAELRDTLLPHLMSGELKINDVNL